MKKQISKFSVHQTSKILALVMSTVYMVFGIIGGTIFFIQGQDHHASVATVFFAGIMIFLIGLFVSYVTYATTAFIYNLWAELVGGIEFEVEDLDKND